MCIVPDKLILRAFSPGFSHFSPSLAHLSLSSIHLRWVPPAAWLQQALAALTVSLPELSPCGHVVAMSAVAVLAAPSVTGGAAGAAGGAGGAGLIAAFVDRTMQSAFLRREEFR